MDNKKFNVVLLKSDSEMIVVSVSCKPRGPNQPRIRYDIGEIVAAIREEHPNIGDYLFGATLINYYPDKTEAQFGFKPKKRQVLHETVQRQEQQLGQQELQGESRQGKKNTWKGKQKYQQSEEEVVPAQTEPLDGLPQE